MLESLRKRASVFQNELQTTVVLSVDVVSKYFIRSSIVCAVISVTYFAECFRTKSSTIEGSLCLSKGSLKFPRVIGFLQCEVSSRLTWMGRLLVITILSVFELVLVVCSAVCT